MRLKGLAGVALALIILALAGFPAYAQDSRPNPGKQISPAVVQVIAYDAAGCALSSHLKIFSGTTK